MTILMLLGCATNTSCTLGQMVAGFTVMAFIPAPFIFFFMYAMDWVGCGMVRKQQQNQQSQLDAAFLRNVADTAKALRDEAEEENEQEEDSKTSSLLRFDSFEAGVFHVQLKNQEISSRRKQKKRSDQPVADAATSAHSKNTSFLQPSLLTLHVAEEVRKNASCGWKMQGSRRIVINSAMEEEEEEDVNDDVATIEEGWMAPSGKAYWVEKSAERLILFVGRFLPSGDSSSSCSCFEGEWVTSKGERGRFRVFQRVASAATVGVMLRVDACVV